MKLTTQQKSCFDNMIKAVDKTEKCIRFDGSAGTGKTFTMSKVVEHYIVRDKGIFCITSTHKALNVMKQSMINNMSEEVFERINFMTICSFLGKRLSVDENGERCFNYSSCIDKKGKKKPRYVMNKNGDIRPIDLVIIDEWSMVAEEDFKLLKEIEIPKIFLGDECQLGPDNNIIKKEVKSIGKLHDIMRTDDNKLQELYMNARDFVEKKNTPQDFLNYLLNQEDSNIIRVTNDDKEFIQMYNKEENGIILDFRVAMTSRYNNKIRKQKFKGIKSNEKYVAGEKMVFTDFYFDAWSVIDDITMFTTEKEREELIKSLHNIVDNIKELDIDIDVNDYTMYTQTPITITKCTRVFEKLPFMFSELELFKLYFEYDGAEIWCYKLADETAFTNKMKLFKEKFRQLIYDTTDFNKDFYELCCMFDIKYPREITGSKPRIEDTIDIWKFITTIEKLVSAPIDYNYATTIHKCQGSTYENVYIDLRSSLSHLDLKNVDYYKFVNSKIPVEFKEPTEWNMIRNAKLIYTGITRASKSIVILI